MIHKVKLLCEKCNKIAVRTLNDEGYRQYQETDKNGKCDDCVQEVIDQVIAMVKKRVERGQGASVKVIRDEEGRVNFRVEDYDESEREDEQGVPSEDEGEGEAY